MFWSRKKRFSDAQASSAEELWGAKAEEKLTGQQWMRTLWQSHPITQAHLRYYMTGDPGRHWLSFVKDRYCPTPRDRGLSLGCGEGSVERESIRQGVCRQMVGLDFAAAAIEIARREARSVGFQDSIRYDVADLDHITFSADTYDIIIASHSVHHLTHLEHVASELHKALKPDGILILNEYVGPSRYQWSEKAGALMNDLLRILPREKRFVARDNSYRDVILPLSHEQVIAVDPSESVRSDEILPVFEKYFVMDHRGDFGGTLLQFLLGDIIANFDENNAADRALIDLLVYFEATLIREGVLTSDFVFAVMKPLRRS
ncbi:MAG: class I SAM-dependent methyltransferase [Candidatus Sumerlaeaceae bacterium]